MASMIRLAAVGSLTIAGCANGGIYHLEHGPQAPTAQGMVRTWEQGNGETRVKVDVENLAPPDKLSAGATTYVVWVSPAGQQGGAQNLGAITVGNHLKGRLTAMTALRDFRIDVTPEPSPMVTAPSSPPVLGAHIARR